MQVEFCKIIRKRTNNKYYISIVYVLFLMSDRELINIAYTECGVSN